MVKVYTPRRIRERNRWLRSDGKPNFKSRIHETPPKLEPMIRRDVPRVGGTAPVLKVCEVLSNGRLRLIPIIGGGGVEGVITGMDVIDYLGGGPRHKLVMEKGIHLLYDALSLPVSEIMSRKVLSVDADAKLDEVLETMIKFGVGSLPVVSRRGFEGLITESEILRFLSGKSVGVPVKEVMTSEVITADEGYTLDRLMKLMVNAGIRRVPVVDRGEVKGIVSWRDVVGLIGRHEVFKIVKSETVDEFKSLPVSYVMRKDLLTVGPDMDIGDVASEMMRRGVGHALVVEGSRLKGIATERDIIYGLIVRGE